MDDRPLAPAGPPARDAPLFAGLADPDPAELPPRPGRLGAADPPLDPPRLRPAALVASEAGAPEVDGLVAGAPAEAPAGAGALAAGADGLALGATAGGGEGAAPDGVCEGGGGGGDDGAGGAAGVPKPSGVQAQAKPAPTTPTLSAERTAIENKRVRLRTGTTPTQIDFLPDARHRSNDLHVFRTQVSAGLQPAGRGPPRSFGSPSPRDGGTWPLIR